MVVKSRLMINEAKRRFPVRICLAVPRGGFGPHLDKMMDWLDQNCGADGWKMTPAGIDATAIYFRDPALATAFVARWCIGYRIEPGDGTFLVREDEPAPHGSPLGCIGRHDPTIVAKTVEISCTQNRIRDPMSRYRKFRADDTLSPVPKSPIAVMHSTRTTTGKTLGQDMTASEN